MVDKLGRLKPTAGQNTEIFGASEYVEQIDDRVRELAALIRAWLERPQWTDYDEVDILGATSFAVTGDATKRYNTGRRVLAVVAGIELPGRVTEVNYNAATDETFVDLDMDDDASITGASAILVETIPAADPQTIPVIIPQGTKMLFVQASAPTGWTLDQTHMDRVLRVVNTSGGTTGGNWTISGLTTATVVLDEDQLPAHWHYVLHGVETNSYTLKDPANKDNTLSGGRDSGSRSDWDATSLPQPANAGRTSLAGGAETPTGHNHAISADGQWRPLYVDAIICVKD